MGLLCQDDSYLHSHMQSVDSLYNILKKCCLVCDLIPWLILPVVGFTSNIHVCDLFVNMKWYNFHLLETKSKKQTLV